jgi:outer membrane protein assembly factor BamB
MRGDYLHPGEAVRSPSILLVFWDGKDPLRGHNLLRAVIREHYTPDVPSPLVFDDLVYLCREDGTLLCLNAKTGKEVYQKRGHSDRHRASPVYADGKIYLTARDGTVTVVSTGTNFNIVSQNSIGEPISASPAISNGKLYLRSFSALYAISKPTK